MVRMMAWLLGFVVGLGCVACVAPRMAVAAKTAAGLWRDGYWPYSDGWKFIIAFPDMAACEEALPLIMQSVALQMRRNCELPYFHCYEERYWTLGSHSLSVPMKSNTPGGEVHLTRFECIPATIDPRTK